jgi:hypothetical protein
LPKKTYKVAKTPVEFVKVFQTPVTPLVPEQFGAIGDGKTPDGKAINALLTYVNKIEGEQKVSIELNGTYNISGDDKHQEDVNGATISHIQGLIPITRNNIDISGNESTLLVPVSIPFNKTIKGKHSSDMYANCIYIKSNNCKISNLNILGNIDKRKVIRGDSVSGYGGAEFGVVLGGNNNSLLKCKVVGWGTDCIFIYGNNALVRDCIVSVARRNVISIVPYPVLSHVDDIYEINITDTKISKGGFGNANTWNRPGTGIQVEAGERSRGTKVSVKLNNIIFTNNRRSDLQLSKNAVACTIKNSIFSNKLNLRPGQLGGHLIEGNTFEQNSSIVITNSQNIDDEVFIYGNSYCKSPFVDQKTAFTAKPFMYNQAVIMKGNEQIHC